ncbi:hypothetical protein ACEU6E_09795 [Halorutilales archaeon Cl-col2-1]
MSGSSVEDSDGIDYIVDQPRDPTLRGLVVHREVKNGEPRLYVYLRGRGAKVTGSLNLRDARITRLENADGNMGLENPHNSKPNLETSTPAETQSVYEDEIHLSRDSEGLRYVMNTGRLVDAFWVYYEPTGSHPSFSVDLRSSENISSWIYIGGSNPARVPQSTRVPLGFTHEDDTDGDGIPDSDEEDGIITAGGDVYVTNPSRRDTDGDGLGDGDEIGKRAGGVYYGTVSDPTRKDTDGDGLIDPEELNTGTDPFEIDTDGDGVSDSLDARPTVENPDPA